ncbi:S8 family serine peptidase [Tenacibaculum sp. M341]|uniref:S8 family serine peptidase n=1 Tax=Tenacibaculum sp. M341 TaxID=2530339 RepID=UPI001051C8FE|nr:S8 family serine peptidase [Tenacibaculum sp. M341]TCI92159.1 T9SS type A sorting domain-containing protein [Tenacibaculum sp. M341]
MKINYFGKLLFSAGLLTFSLQLQSQTKNQVEKIRSNYNLTQLKTLKQAIKKSEASERAEALRIAKQKGWQTKITNADGTYMELQKVVNNQPIYYTTFNVDAARSTRTNHLHNGGSLGLDLMGQGMTAHVWDGGLARASHQEYDGAGGNNRFSIGDNSSTLNFHAAHVTGTIIASGVRADAKGMAPHAKALGYDWNSDQSEATGAAGNGMLVSNHSYGFRGDLVPDYYFGAYITESRNWDEIMFNAPNYLMVVAAGNDGNQNGYNGSPLGGNSSYDKLTGHATAKNNLVVANAQDANIDSNGNLLSVSINSSSSEGPTDDFRIKPDITGNGTGVYSTYESSNTAYNTITGTSMASPNVAGSLLILQQHYNNVNGNFMRAATLKGLALHTADDVGTTGPDPVYGWGLLNAKAAAEAITNNGNGSKVEELTLTSGQTYSITVDSDGSNPLYASISWTDRPGTATTATNSSTPRLVNDLDIRVTKGGTTYTPWRLTGVTTNGKGDNNVDPYERVDISGASGSYTITVTHKGSLTGGSQNYTLIVTGVTGTPAVCNATTPTGVGVTGVSQTEATVNWSSVAAATYSVRYREVGTSSWTTSSATSTSADLSGLSASTQYEVQVRSVCSDGSTSSYSSSVTFTTDAPVPCQSLPYSESFESNEGWTQVGGDDGDWVRDASGTPSSGTGPSNGANGSFYMFLEASTNGSTGQIGNNATAILESPCFDLSSESSATFSFSNHMYGTSVGSLTLQASTGGAWATIWSDSGNKGNQWNDVSVNLSSYLGQNSVSFRFVGTTGSSWSSDIAIDNISITAGGGGDPDPGCASLDFNDYTITSFSNQDSAGNFSIGSGGSSLTLTNNTWKYIPLDYTVTANTVIEFEFSSTSQGEIHGIGFENDNSLTSSRYFKVHGTQNYGVTNFDNYAGGTQTYVIPVGDSYTGSMDRLVFINDNDAGSGNNSTFSNVKIYEGSCGNSAFLLTTFGTRTDVLGDQDEDVFTSVQVAPNPVNKGSLLKIIGSNSSLTNTTYSVINMIGQVVEKGSLNESRAINVDQIKSGVYILRLENEFTKTNRRFIVK